MQETDKRKSPRCVFPFLAWNATVRHQKGALDVICLNVSRGGTGLQALDKLPVGTDFEIAFRDLAGDKYYALGRVTRSTHAGVGAEWLHTDPALVAVIDRQTEGAIS